MEVLWYIIIAALLVVFFVLDGYDFGVGIIHLFFAKSERDRLVIAKSAGLFWDSNEVWLVAAGGMIFMAFPTFYASVFSGFYLPLNIVLWLIVFRAIGLEFRSQFAMPLWRDFWDKAFGVASLLLALFFGIALGNIVRGVNLGSVKHGQSFHEAHYFFVPLWNDFNPLSSDPGVIDGFTVTIGAMAVIALTIHGANWIVLKTNASINHKLPAVIFRLSVALLVLTGFSLLLWTRIHPNLWHNFITNPLFLFFPLVYFVGLFGGVLVHKVKGARYRFLLSSALIVGGIVTTLVAVFPVVLPSSNHVNGPLTIYNTGSGTYAMSAALPWGILGVVLLVVYFLVQRRLTAGKIDDMDYGH